MKTKIHTYVVAKDFSNAFLDRTICYSIILNSCLVLVNFMLVWVFKENTYYTVDESIYIVTETIKDIFVIYHTVFVGMTGVLALYLAHKRADIKRITKVIVLMCIHTLFVFGLRFI